MQKVASKDVQRIRWQLGTFVQKKQSVTSLTCMSMCQELLEIEFSDGLDVLFNNSIYFMRISLKSTAVALVQYNARKWQ